MSKHTLGTPGPDEPPIRLAVVTDLHLEEVSELHERIADAMRRADPDALLLVGDSIDDPEGVPVLAELLELLPATDVRIATLGNWEHWSRVDVAALRRVYERGDTRLLVNEAARLDDRAVIYGTDDSLAGSPSLEGLPDEPEADTVLLSHCPAFRDSLRPSDSRITAVISGHTHGGQVAIAGWAPVRPPGSGRYVSGWYRDDGPDLFVSRGVGTSMVPIRLGSEPELAIIDWHPRSG